MVFCHAGLPAFIPVIDRLILLSSSTLQWRSFCRFAQVSSNSPCYRMWRCCLCIFFSGPGGGLCWLSGGRLRGVFYFLGWELCRAWVFVRFFCSFCLSRPWSTY